MRIHAQLSAILTIGPVFISTSRLWGGTSRTHGVKQASPQPTDATKKPIDSSARNSLIYIGVTGVPSGFRPASGGEGRRENAKTERKSAGRRQKWLATKSARTRRNPHKQAIAGKKKPTGEPVGFLIWWSWGDLNPRPQAFFGQIYMFSGLI